MYYPPIQGHAYIIGADPSMGIVSDYHAMTVFDITNMYEIKQVATFYDNETPPKIFAYMLAKIGTLYNNAYIAIENNGCSQVTLNALWADYEYEFIVNEGGNPRTSIGIHSSNPRKALACINFKNMVEDPNRMIELNDGRLIAEMETFERKLTTQSKMPTYASVDGHDDFMMATIWAMYSTRFEIIERYYDVKKMVVDKVGENSPLIVLPFKIEGLNPESYLKDIDDRLVYFRDSIERLGQENEETIKSMNVDEFIKAHNLTTSNASSDPDADDRDPDDGSFGFSVF